MAVSPASLGGVRPLRPHVHAGRTTLPQMLGDRDELPAVLSSASNDDTGSARSVCVRNRELPAREPLVSAAMGGRRPPAAGRARPARAVHVFCDWIRHELEAELGRRWEIKMNGVGVPNAYASGQQLASSSTRHKSSQQPFSLPSLFNLD
jgi:hypothetical protein